MNFSEEADKLIPISLEDTGKGFIFSKKHFIKENLSWQK